MIYCRTCDANPAIAKGECMTCYQYRKRKGHQRPRRLHLRQFDLNHRRLGRTG